MFLNEFQLMQNRTDTYYYYQSRLSVYLQVVYMLVNLIFTFTITDLLWSHNSRIKY